jgi:hypothetical protein
LSAIRGGARLASIFIALTLPLAGPAWAAGLLVWSPLDSFGSQPSEERYFRNEIQGRAFTEIDYPWGALKQRLSLKTPARTDPTRAMSSGRVLLESVSGSTSLGLVWRSDIFASTNATIADEARWIYSGYLPYYHRLGGDFEAFHIAGFGPRIAHRVTGTVGAASIELAGAFSVVVLDEMNIARGAGQVSQSFGQWTRLDATAHVARSGLTFPFGGSGSESGWAWSSDWAAHLRLPQGTGASLVINDAFGQAHWARLPTTDYKIRVINTNINRCCAPRRDPSLTFQNHFAKTSLDLPMRWRVDAYQDMGRFRLGVGESSSYGVTIPHVSIALMSGRSQWALEVPLGTRTISLGYGSARTRIQMTLSPSDPERSYALMLGVSISMPY